MSPIVDAPLRLPGRQVGTGKKARVLVLRLFLRYFLVDFSGSPGGQRELSSPAAHQCSEQVRPRGARDAQGPSTATCAAAGSTVEARRWVLVIGRSEVASKSLVGEEARNLLDLSQPKLHMV